MRQLSLRIVVIGASVLGSVTGHTAVASAQAAPAHPAGHEGMKSDRAMPKDDASYVQMMQMHHQQGIDMAKIAVDKSSREDIKGFAHKMIDAQQKEIEELRLLQQSLKTGSAMQNAHEGMMNGEMDKMMSDLRQVRGAAFDQKFIAMMIPHHQQAIAMSKPPAKFKAPDVQAFAKKVITAQTAEVKELQQMRKKS